MKGAVKVVMEFCLISEGDKARINAAVERFSSDGFRTLAVAKYSKSVKGTFIYIKLYVLLLLSSLLEYCRDLWQKEVPLSSPTSRVHFAF